MHLVGLDVSGFLGGVMDGDGYRRVHTPWELRGVVGGGEGVFGWGGVGGYGAVRLTEAATRWFIQQLASS